MIAMKTPMERVRTKRTLNVREERVRSWILKNHGVLTRIANEQNVSPQYVQKLAYGRSDSPSREMRVERALEALGCPIMRMR